MCLAQLDKMGEFNRRRKKLVRIIEQVLTGVPDVELARPYPDTEPNYWAYPIQVPSPLGTYGEINYLEEEYRKMLSFVRGDSTVAFVPDESDWSPWSQFYEQPGAASPVKTVDTGEDEQLRFCIDDDDVRTLARHAVVR